MAAAIIVFATIAQGMSRVSFSLVASPCLSVMTTGTSPVGFVNLLGAVQNVWVLWRSAGNVKWAIFQRVAFGLVVGFVVGVIPLYYIDDDLRPALVAASALGSVVLQFWYKPPRGMADSGFAAGAEAGLANTYAGVGEGPLEGFARRSGWDNRDFARTMALCLGIINVASIPLLGLPPISLLELVVAVVLMLVGIVIGMQIRRLLGTAVSERVAQVLVVCIVLGCLVRAIAVIP